LTEPTDPSWIQEARECVSRADEAYQAGQFQRGLGECDVALAIDPGCAEAHNLRGILLEELNRLREAAIAYREAFRIDPRLSDVRENQLALADDCLVEATRLFEEGQDYGRALECCEVTLLVDPTCAEAHNLRGVVLEELDRLGEAAEAYRQALRLNPDLQVDLDNLAYLEEELADQEDEEAGTDDEFARPVEGADLTDASSEAPDGDDQEDALVEHYDGAAEPERADAIDGAVAAVTAWFGPWLLAFGRVIYQPAPGTFRDLAADAAGKFSGSVAWLAFLAIFSALFDWFVMLHRSFDPRLLILTGTRMIMSSGVVLLYIAITGIFVRKVFRRRRSYSAELTYVIVVIYVAIGVLSKSLALLPWFGTALTVLTVVAYVYMLVLSGIAVRAITRLTGWQAAAAVAASAALSYLLVLVVFGAVVLFLFSVLGPAAGQFIYQFLW
jgi:Flp pilus assembly protein TadD